MFNKKLRGVAKLEPSISKFFITPKLCLVTDISFNLHVF